MDTLLLILTAVAVLGALIAGSVWFDSLGRHIWAVLLALLFAMWLASVLSGRDLMGFKVFSRRREPAAFEIVDPVAPASAVDVPASPSLRRTRLAARLLVFAIEVLVAGYALYLGGLHLNNLWTWSGIGVLLVLVGIAYADCKARRERK